jgi:hypothetical protein
MKRHELCRLCAQGMATDAAVNGRPAHQVWRLLKNCEYQITSVVCDSEIERIVGMITHPAKFSVDYAALIGVRPLEDGRFAVWWLDDPHDARTEAKESVYADPYEAARIFILWRAERHLGADFEGGS